MKNLSIPALALALLSPFHCSAEQGAAPASVDIIFVANGVAFGTRIDDAILEKIGCAYTFRDTETFSKLLKLAEAARDVPQDANDPRPNFEVRNKLLFHFQEDPDISVRFGQKYLNQSYLDGSWNSVPMHLQNDLVEQVRATIRKAGGTQANKNASGSCEGS